MNKKNLSKIYLVLSFAAMFSSCVFNVDGSVGKGPVVEQSYQVTSFSVIETSSSADVTVVKGDSLQVTLSDYENLIEFWDVKVLNNSLIIRTKPFTSLINSRAKVTVVMPNELYRVAVSGSGTIDLNSAFNTLEKATISGSGNINGNVNTVYSKLNLTISGSGSFNFIGSTQELKAVTTGSGRMNLNDLEANDAVCTISGSGNMYVHAKDSLKVVITGSGNVVYSGNPLIDVNASGSGSLKHR